MEKKLVKLLVIPLVLVLVLGLAGCCLFAKKKEVTPTEEVKPAAAVEEAQPVPEVAEEGLDALKRAAQAEGALLPIYFDFDKYNLKPEAKTNLDKTAAWLSKNPTVKIRIEGNCDERGTNEYNMALGERRANSAKDYLVKLGIASDRLETASWGEEKPICTEHNEACWSQNRRDDFNPITR
ncbi:MAG: peptidoglycan-associated lipoprotein Pal [Desulfobacterota bacterium]|nr:peptidoglycan-associated lipoprotein Pal [Thermodesulfobacteriota bacterium]